MAFLAVLKEGFETAVFLLAAAQTSQGTAGWRCSAGLPGSRRRSRSASPCISAAEAELGRFFRVTGVFLVLIAAGLVLGALRTAHEAGWVTIGQQQVFNFSSWMPGNSVQGALITGVFGIPADPRLIEVLGWLLYTVPVLVVFLWPARLAAAPRTRRRLLAATSAALLIAAAVLAIVVPAGGSPPAHRPHRDDRAGHTATVSLASGPRETLPSQPAHLECPHIALTAAGDHIVDGVAGARVAGQRRRGPRTRPPDGHLGAVVEFDRGPAAGGCFGRPNPRSVPGAMGRDHRVHRARA